jgi:hypothetical protein
MQQSAPSFTLDIVSVWLQDSLDVRCVGFRGLGTKLSLGRSTVASERHTWASGWLGKEHRTSDLNKILVPRVNCRPTITITITIRIPSSEIVLWINLYKRYKALSETPYIRSHMSMRVCNVACRDISVALLSHCFSLCSLPTYKLI